MYIVTFYSFKGGVGRSLAMMNCAAELVQKGRKVLVVDFDLEAPGLESFNLPLPRGKKKGIVDYVRNYLKTNSAPSIEPYLYKIDLDPKLTGELCMMPAGDRSRGYDQRLLSIDWQDLYERRDGYLLFENLKAQWRKYLNPDYVLIDSRTGYTDVGEICTRQLPDAVVFMYFPNEQNLSGLSRIVRKIRDDASKRNKKLQFYFVPSNVPDFDDENRILRKRLKEFKRILDFDEVTATIHHYPSLSLLNQELFTIKRPKSRLAAEYRLLTEKIQQANLKDEEDAISFLKNTIANIEKAISEEYPGESTFMVDRSLILQDFKFTTDENNKLSYIYEQHKRNIQVMDCIVDLVQRLEWEDVAESIISEIKLLDHNYVDPKVRTYRENVESLSDIIPSVSEIENTETVRAPQSEQ